MSLELKIKDQDVAVIVLNLKFGIKSKDRGTCDTQMIVFLIATQGGANTGLQLFIWKIIQ